jgi:hypothetical protein
MKTSRNMLPETNTPQMLRLVLVGTGSQAPAWEPASAKLRFVSAGSGASKTGVPQPELGNEEKLKIAQPTPEMRLRLGEFDPDGGQID